MRSLETLTAHIDSSTIPAPPLHTMPRCLRGAETLDLREGHSIPDTLLGPAELT